jgi:hypothetical protein
MSKLPVRDPEPSEFGSTGTIVTEPLAGRAVDIDVGDGEQLRVVYRDNNVERFRCPDR